MITCRSLLACVRRRGDGLPRIPQGDDLELEGPAAGASQSGDDTLATEVEDGSDSDGTEMDREDI